MKAIVIYDSVDGNTQKIAETIAASLGKGVKAVRPREAGASELAGIELLVIGSPTHGGRPTDPVTAFMETATIPSGARVAVFDTRLRMRLLKVFGYAADRLAASLREKGARVVASEGFFVARSAGPLVDGEEQRAAQWGRGLHG